MTPIADLITTILSAATFLLGIAVVIFFGVYLMVRGLGESMRGSIMERALRFVGTHALSLGLVITLAGVAGTLYYSEIVGFEPCKLCWFQRILFYPQLFIFAVALLRKTRDAFEYTLPLSIAGFATAVYHYALQKGFSSPFPCSADVAASCSKQFFVKFGYITEVMMSVTAFAALIALAVAYTYATKESASDTHSA